MKLKSNKKTIIKMFALALVFGACSSKKEARVAESVKELPRHYRDYFAADTASVAKMRWREFYTDANLQELIEKGLAYNQNLLIAVDRIAIAGSYLKQSKQLWLPEAGLNASGQYRDISENGFLSSLGNYESYTAGLNFTWEADIWGKIKNQKKIALTDYLQSREAKDAVQTRLVRDIATGYYNLLLLDQKRTITTANLKLADSTYTMTNLLYQQGRETRLGLQQIGANRESIAALIQQVEQHIITQENALRQLTGQFPGSVLRKGTLDNIESSDRLTVGIPIDLLQNRADVRLSEMEVLKANSRMGIARSNMYPSLLISASGGFESLKLSDWFNMPSSLFGIVGGTLLQPIFSRRKLKTQYEVAQIERSLSITRFRQTLMAAVSEVSTVLAQKAHLKQQQEILKRKVDDLRGAVKNARNLYREGSISYLEVFAAQDTSLRAELELNHINYLILESLSALYAGLGGGIH